MIKCDSPEDQHLFISGMKEYATHAHIGFTDTIEHYYCSGTEQFIYELQNNGLYNPVGAMQL